MRERKAAPTLHLIKVLKQRDQKEEKKQISFIYLFIYVDKVCVVFMCLILGK